MPETEPDSDRWSFRGVVIAVAIGLVVWSLAAYLACCR